MFTIHKHRLKSRYERLILPLNLSFFTLVDNLGSSLSGKSIILKQSPLVKEHSESSTQVTYLRMMIILNILEQLSNNKRLFQSLLFTTSLWKTFNETPNAPTPCPCP